MNNQPTSLEEILRDMPNAWCEDCEHPRCIGKKQSAKAALTTYIDSLVEEVIGSNEAISNKLTGGNKANYSFIMNRNKLRAKQRTRYDKLKGERG